ncbi:non-histone chromosomal protein HMG-14-like [Echinops telfairi]|uniref:Non-histone chromosomal protein HMG-14-like n=1 Tax=Echinops telfairi TaxID=9371 RepID=A0AC55D453_ECHTE|nr:non-histone chromosomal protein HMG-14-like [Echinops telfairi]
MLQRKAFLAEKAEKAESKRRSKMEMKPQQAARKDKSSDKRVQAKGKKGAKAKEAEVAHHETKGDLPAENGEMKGEEIPASDEAGVKEAKSD